MLLLLSSAVNAAAGGNGSDEMVGDATNRTASVNDPNAGRVGGNTGTCTGNGLFVAVSLILPGGGSGGGIEGGEFNKDGGGGGAPSVAAFHCSNFGSGLLERMSISLAILEGVVVFLESSSIEKPGGRMGSRLPGGLYAA